METSADTENEEMRNCNNLWKAELGFIEINAKEEAGYNAAWKYHCTYEELFGENPVNVFPNDVDKK